MLTLTIEVDSGHPFALVLMNLFKKRNPATAGGASQPDLANLKPTDARTGDVISIAGVGDDMTDLDFTADRSIWYHAGGAQLVRSERPVPGAAGLDAVSTNEDEIEVAVHNDPRKLTLDDLGAQRGRPGADGRAPESRPTPSSSTTRCGCTGRARDAHGEARRSAATDELLLLGVPGGERQAPDGRSETARRAVQVSMYHGVPVADVTVYRR